MNKSKLMDGALIGLLVVVSGFVLVRTVWSGRHAPTPVVFEAGYSFEEAKRVSAESGKPIFVVASADWCGPCQTYKRGALSNDAVQEAIGATFVAAYVNVDEQPNAAAELSVMSIPLTAIILNGEIVKRVEGAMSTRQLLEVAREYGGADSYADAGG